jgi:hypothetical protein
MWAEGRVVAEFLPPGAEAFPSLRLPDFVRVAIS